MSYGNTGTAMQSGGITGYNVPMSAPTPMSPMQEARAALSGGVNTLHERIEELERRLASVLRPTGPDANAALGAVPTPVLSEHRQFLGCVTGDVHGVIGRVESLLNRLEL